MKTSFLKALMVCGALGLLTAGIATGETRADAEKDPVLKAMLVELDRSVSQLQLPGFQKPYFIQYRVEDVDEYSASAEFGASEGAGRARRRIAVVTVRVGDHKTDSSGGPADGAAEQTCLGDDAIALRSALWSATDQAYKAALAAYAQKQAALKQVQTPPQADDFSQEKPLVSLGSVAKLDLGAGDWEQRMAHASGFFRAAEVAKLAGGTVEQSSAAFEARATTTWIVNNEGTVVRKGATDYQENVSVATQADDGMRLARSYSSTGISVKDLDAADGFEAHALDLLGTLGALRQAPLVEEEYHGPILLSSDASADTLHALLIGVTAVRPRLGTEARTIGPLASSYHARILPEFIDVVDDPGLKSYGGKGLVGAYDVDDEGVAAEAVKLVDAGKLDNYLIGRQPVRDFPASNGHGRAGVVGPARPSLGVLKAGSREGASDAELNQRLLEIGKDRGLDHVYFVETLGGVRLPRLLWRLGLDGKRTLVRGSQLADVDARTLRSSVALAGKELFVANEMGEVSVTVLAPALLVEDATLRRANEQNEKLPFYPAPK